MPAFDRRLSVVLPLATPIGADSGLGVDGVSN
jgi:hypothetical protein